MKIDKKEYLVTAIGIVGLAAFAMLMIWIVANYHQEVTMPNATPAIVYRSELDNGEACSKAVECKSYFCSQGQCKASTSVKPTNNIKCESKNGVVTCQNSSGELVAVTRVTNFSGDLKSDLVVGGWSNIGWIEIFDCYDRRAFYTTATVDGYKAYIVGYRYYNTANGILLATNSENFSLSLQAEYFSCNFSNSFE